MASPEKIARHNHAAPYWAIGLIIFGLSGMLTIWVDLGSFWTGYVLDMTGPAWNYILFRGLFTSYTDNLWIRFFTPIRTFLIFISVCLAIEAMQYFKIYESTFDPWDLLAYTSILVPLFLLDLKHSRI